MGAKRKVEAQQEQATTVAPVLLTEKQAAELLHTPQRTLQGWRLRGTGPRYLKLQGSKRGSVRYRREDLEAYLESCVVEPKR
jgi:hypothetical protein